MRIFMTGGSGMIGRPLVARLLARGDDVSIVTRRGDELRRHRGWGRVRVVPGDPSEPGRWQAEVDGADVVVSLAGLNLFARRWSVEVRRQIRDTRVYSTENLVEAIRAARKPPRVFVQGSAVGFYGSTGDAEVTESSPSGADFLAVVCRELELAARESERMGLRASMIRTGVVLGRGEGALGVMAPMFRWFGGAPVGSGGSWARPATGRQWMSWIHLEDIVGVFLRAIDDPEAAGPINGSAPNPCRNIDFARTLARALRRPCLPIGPPDALLRLALGGVASAVTSGQKVVPSRAIELGYRFVHPDLDEAIRSTLASEPASLDLLARTAAG